MKKKISDKDKKDWLNFINSKDKIEIKDNISQKQKSNLYNRKIDLHGYSLDEANKIIYNFILYCYRNNVKKISIITGKGSRSKNKDNPFQSENLSILKHSVPDFIKSKIELLKVIKFINEDDIQSSTKGSFDIFLKNYDKKHK